MIGSRLLFVAAFIAKLVIVTGCAPSGNVVVGNIPPSTFQFTTVVKWDGDGPGGWQIAQVAVLLGRLSPMFPRVAICEVEVGMPVANTQLGLISVAKAQRESATAADKAAHKLLGERKKPTASACIAFRTEMRAFLRRAIAGSKVDRFGAWPGKRIPRRTFPPKRGP